jgi:hypothetical protein
MEGNEQGDRAAENQTGRVMDCRESLKRYIVNRRYESRFTIHE